MLTRVSVGQVRFTAPGLSADARGVASGRELLLRFSTLDRVVGFLRLLSAERCPDEVWSGLKLSHARPEKGLREVLARAPNPGGPAADLIAAAARLSRGACLTGTGRHFVPWKDARAPFGYDAVAAAHDEGDLTVYTEEGPVPLRFEGELPVRRLLLRLELRPSAGGVEHALVALATLAATAGPEGHGSGAPAARGGPDARASVGATPITGEGGAGRAGVFLAVRQGLGPVLVESLFRARVPARVAVCETRQEGGFRAEKAFWLFQIPALPPRLLGLCAHTPGVVPYLSPVEDVLVAAGYEHPVHLGGCGALFRGDRLLLLSPAPRPPLEIEPRPLFVGIEDLVKVSPRAGEDPWAQARSLTAPNPLEVPLRLQPSSGGVPRVRGVLVRWAQSGWLRRMVYALPGFALAGYRVAFLDTGVLVLAPDRLEGIAFGQLLEEPVPGVLVPVGRELRPALSPALLRERLGLGEGAFCLFPDESTPPYRIAAGQMEPLERRVLARADLPWAPARKSVWAATAGGDPPPEIENDALGLLPLWGLGRR